MFAVLFFRKDGVVTGFAGSMPGEGNRSRADLLENGTTKMSVLAERRGNHGLAHYKEENQSHEQNQYQSYQMGCVSHGYPPMQ